jgi:MscS family membrane protein
MLLKKFSLLKILLLINNFNLLPAYAQTTPVQTPATTASSQPPAQMESKPLAFISNEELLQQFQAIIRNIETNLLAHLRAVVEQKVLLEQHQRQKPSTVKGKTENYRENDELKKEAKVDTANKNDLENAKQQLATLEKQLAYQEVEKALLEKYYKQIDLAQTEIAGFIQLLEKSNKYALQIELRLNDGTLLPTQLPDELGETTQELLRQQLLTQQQSLKQHAAQVQAQLTEQTEQLAQTQTAVVDAQASYAAATERHTQMLKRQELEQQYLQQAPETLSNELKVLQEEWTWLFSSLQTVQHRFAQAQEAQQAMAKKLAEMRPPDTSQLQEMKAEDIQQATTLFEQIEEYQRERMISLLMQQRSLQEVIEHGEALTGEATVINAHLFKMEVIASVFEKLIEAGKAKPEQIPETLRLEFLNTINKRVSEMLAEAKGAVENAKLQLEKQAQEQEQAPHAIESAQQRLANLKKANETMLQTQKWEEQLKQLDAKEVAQRFQEITEKLTAHQQTLKEKQADFEQAQTAVNEAKQKLDALKDPLLREIVQVAQGEQQAIVKNLYQFARLTKPDKQEKIVNSPSTNVKSTPIENTIITNVGKIPTSESVESVESTAANKSAQSNPQAELEATLEQYQNQLAGYLDTHDKRSKQRAILLEALQTFAEKIQAYQEILDVTYAQAQQHHANAIELKKRVGRAELESVDIPTGINAALQSDKIEALEAKREILFRQQSQVKQDIKRFTPQEETVKTQQETITEIHTLTGKRLDSLRQAQKLAENFAKQRENRSEIEQKTLAQAARRRIRLENTLAEFFLVFFHSEEVDNLTDILQEYYLELSELESKIKNLQQQKEKHELAVSYLNEEKNVIPKLLPLLEKKAEHLQQQYAETEVLLKARLVPEQAEQLLATYTAESGQNLSTPQPISADMRTEYLEKEAKILFDLQMQQRAITKWIARFTSRLSTSGADAEMGFYQNHIAALETEEAALQHRIAAISGHPSDTLLSEEEVPTTPLERLRFFKGEIGVLRADRIQLYKQLIYLIGSKLLVIWVLSLVAVILINFFATRAIKRIQREIEQGENIDKSSPSVHVLLRKIFKFGVWSLAFIFTLEALGFNVGAILAGLGIGGLALAMAAKNVLADLLGGMTVMMLGLYKIGEMIEFKGKAYIVKEIGLRYTLLEDFSYNYKVKTPNSLLSEAEVISISSHPGYTVLTNISLSSDNPAEKITLAVDLIKQIIDSHPGARFIWTKLDHFDNQTFVIRMHYDILKFKERAKVETEINVGVVRRFQQRGIQLVPVSRLTVQWYSKK